MLKRIGRSHRVQTAAGTFLASWLRLVHRTNRFVIDPADAYDQLELDMPAIITMWHGQHFLMPFFKPPHHRANVLISRHRDGEINALTVERLGIGTIRGSGDTKGRFHSKGGVAAFRTMLLGLRNGVNIVVTADVPKVARRAGEGIVKLAAHSGRPIVPVAIATSRRFDVNSWDRATVNLPFGRGAMVMGRWVEVTAGADADADAVEAARRSVEDSLNAATERAYAIVDGRT